MTGFNCGFLLSSVTSELSAVVTDLTVHLVSGFLLLLRIPPSVSAMLGNSWQLVIIDGIDIDGQSGLGSFMSVSSQRWCPQTYCWWQHEGDGVVAAIKLVFMPSTIVTSLQY